MARRVSSQLGIGIVGCGNIAARYAEDIARQPGVALVAVTDADPARAAALGEMHGARVHPGLEALLADADVQIVANLTPYAAHVPVTRAALEAGRHAFSEKPLAVRADDARELVALARASGMCLGAAPIVAIGEMAQTARQWIDQGRLGTVRLAYADANWGRIEAWHDAPEPFYEVGPLFDVGIYPVSLLTALLGPVVAVTADARHLLPDRVTRAGRRFAPRQPDHVVAALEHATGAVTRLTVNFYVPDPARQRGVELHGDAGSLWLSNWFQFAGTLEHAPYGEPYRAVPLLREPDVPMPWAAGLADIAGSVTSPTVRRALDPNHAVHVIDVLETILRAADTDRPLDVSSRFDQPPPMEWTTGLTALPGT